MSASGFKQIVDVFEVVERIVKIKREFRGLAELEAHFLRKVVADGLGAVLDAFEQFLAFSEGNTERYTFAMLRSGDTLTALTDIMTPWVFAVCWRKISLSSFCSSLDILA